MNINPDQQLLLETLKAITPLDRYTMDQAKKRMDGLAKPPGSLGKLEEIAIHIAGMTGKIKNSIHKKTIIILCSDNGVVKEGVSSAPQSVTLAQTINFTKGLTGVAVLAKHCGAELMIIDVGINARFSHPQVIDQKIRMSTSNIAEGPAMSRAEARRAIAIGIEAARKAIESGAGILGVGEMGIGNTTTSSAVLTALTNCTLNDSVGRGGGISTETFLHKKEIIAKALKINNPDPTDPIDVVAKVGGFDIAAMTGVYLGAAALQVPVVIDGFISIVAALLAARLSPAAAEYMLGSHFSYEVGYSLAARELGINPMLNMDMRLGEGSGCPLAFSIVDSALYVMENMATFEEAEIDDAYLAKISDDWFKV